MASAMSDLRLPSQQQGITAPWPVPDYTAWWQRHMCVNNLPKVVNWKWNGRESNPRPFVSRANALTITPPEDSILVTLKRSLFCREPVQPPWAQGRYFNISVVETYRCESHQFCVKMKRSPGTNCTPSIESTYVNIASPTCGLELIILDAVITQYNRMQTPPNHVLKF